MDHLKAQIQQQCINAICLAVPNCLAIYRFGSWGTEDERPDSDIDLAILPMSPIAPMSRWDLAQQLASLAGRDVDLVDLLNASTVLRMQVVGHGERIYCAAAVDEFEDMVFSSYAKLNEERRMILADIAQRGTIYDK